MEDKSFHTMFEIDDSHWWFYGERAWLSQYYQKFKKQGKKWLDVGCGVGDILRRLKDDFIVFGMEINDLGLHYSKKRGIPNLVKADAVDLPFKDDSFDFVSVLGVMYHSEVRDDSLCLKESVRVCKKNGLLFFLEPVVFLKGHYDKQAYTERRYTLKTFKELVLSAGLKIEKASYFCFFAFFPMLLVRKLERFIKTKESDLSRPNALVNFLLVLLVKLESAWIRFLPLPIGSSLVCVARKV